MILVQSEFEYKKYLLIIKLFDMKLIKSIIAKIINSLKFFIVTSSNEQYCKYLRKHGVSISGGGEYLDILITQLLMFRDLV